MAHIAVNSQGSFDRAKEVGGPGIHRTFLISRWLRNRCPLPSFLTARACRVYNGLMELHRLPHVPRVTIPIIAVAE